MIEIDERVLNQPWSSFGDSEVAIVTGGAQGLGMALVASLLDRGVSRVVVLDLHRPQVADPRVLFYECDLSQPRQVEASLSNILFDLAASGLAASILVNNAGVRLAGALHNLDIDAVRASLEVNYLAPVRIMQLVLQNYFARDSTHQLYIVTVSLVLGCFSPCNLSAYSSSKAALILAHESLLVETAACNTVRFLLVLPGQLDTQMFSDVEPSNAFFAPIVSGHRLAEAICDSAEKGRRGTLCMPLYANFLLAVRCLPYRLQMMARRISKMDDKIKAECQI